MVRCSKKAESTNESSRSFLKASSINFFDAFKLVSSWRLRKRDFVKSRFYRIAKKVNPATLCDSDDGCLIEIRESDPTLVALALKDTYGSRWWLKRFTDTFFSATTSNKGDD